MADQVQRFTPITLTQYRLGIYSHLDKAFIDEAQEELDRKPYPTLEGFKVVIKYVAEQNPRAKAVKAEEIVDTSWLKKLDSEGFFDKVYSGK